VNGLSQDGIVYDPINQVYWIYDSGTDSVRKYDLSFNEISSFAGTINAGFAGGEGVAVSGDRLYIVSTGSDTVVVFEIEAVVAPASSGEEPVVTLVPVKITIVDQAAIRQTETRTLPMALSLRSSQLSTFRTATNGMGGRLVRLRNPEFRSSVMVEVPATTMNPESVEEEAAIVKAEAKGRPSSVYVDGEFGMFDQELRHATLGFDGSTWSGGVGFDTLIHPDVIIGLSARAVYSQTDFDENVGSTESEGVVGGVYASYLKNGYFVDGLLSFGQFENDLRRNTDLDGVARAEPDSDFFRWVCGRREIFPG